MTLAAQVIAHTPPYVWLLLVYIAWHGVQALRPRTQPLLRVFVVPVLFIASGLLPLLRGAARGSGGLAAWVLGAVLLGLAGFLTGPTLLAVSRAARTVTRPGSAVPLVRNLVAFVVQYGLAVAVAVHGDRGGWLAITSHAVSGATAGYFMGWMLAAWRQYRAAPAP